LWPQRTPADCPLCRDPGTDCAMYSEDGSSTMRRMLLQEAGHFELAHVPRPESLKRGEVLLRVAWVGISGTELLASQGRLAGFRAPQVIGMHIAGKVVALGPGHQASSDDGEGRWPVKEGSHCVVDPYFLEDIYPPTPSCEPRLKMLGIDLPGGLQDFVVLRASHCHAVASLHSRFHIPLDILAVVCPLALALHACRRGRLERGDYVVVVGRGPFAVATCLCALAQGASRVTLLMHFSSSQEESVTPSSPSQQHTGWEQARKMKGHLRMLMNAGVDVIQAHEDPDLTMNELLKVGPGHLPKLLVDTTGEAESMKFALALVAYQGCLVYAGFFMGLVVVPSLLLHGRELTILASRTAEPSDYKEAIRLVESGFIEAKTLQALVSHRCELEEFSEKMNEWCTAEAEFFYGQVRMGDL